ncbi:hypothetical protein GCM10009775_12940 [Microbacterium aoyamense]|uniref:Uncharacterized protein n=1 Tax=Microbacterium aoyamense TaxID=344166 RepID=A0ABP5AWN1_9MICO|nr:hypothetical protein [Microbacterium aoyamense]
MSHSTEPDDDDLPVYLPPGGAESVPGFLDRLLARLADDPADAEFVFEGVEVDVAQGVWLVPLGGYDPDEYSAQNHPLSPAEYAEVALRSVEDVHRVLVETWGAPQVRPPRLVGVSKEPEGILDYMMVAVGFDEAEVWDRGEFTCALLSGWADEPVTSALRQVMAVMPREYAMGGLAVLADDEITVHDLLMHGEHPLELRRRAWLLSAMFGQGEVRVRDAVLEASRLGLRAKDGTTSVWTFADDGRMLVVLQDPQSEFVTAAADQLIADQLTEEPGDGDTDREEARLILIARMLDGVPADLRELIAAPAETVDGHPAQHELEFRMLGDRPLPIISGLAWFDGEHWRVPASMLEIGALNVFGMDDFGFARAVRRPYRLGGALVAEDFTGGVDEERRAYIERVFAACPVPEQPRPPVGERLGYGLPRDVSHDEMVDQIERASELWWDTDPDRAEGVDGFRVGGRTLSVLDGRILRAVVAKSEPWTVDILRDWVDGLSAAMETRWGRAGSVSGDDPQTGQMRRSPVARVMRGTGLMSAPMWWVNGHAVLLLAGIPDASYDEEPQAILLIAPADAVLDVMRGTSMWELRRRARVLGEVATLTSTVPPPDEIAWSGPPLRGSDLVPRARRGRLRAGDHFWVWHFTHDGRALLLSFPVAQDAAAPSFDDQVDLFAGVPADLMSLVADRDSRGLFGVVTDADTGRSLPAARAVLWFDTYDWRASDGMIRRLRTAADPWTALTSTTLGVGQLLWAWVVGNEFTPDLFSDPQYARHLLDRMPEHDEIAQGFARLGDRHERALTGSLNEFLDVATGMPDRRYFLDAALANPNPRHRREIAFLLLENGVDASIQLSHLTPVNVLFQNPTLSAGDLPLLRRLLSAGARPGPGLGGTSVARDPLEQLADRHLDPADADPLTEELVRQRTGR